MKKTILTLITGSLLSLNSYATNILCIYSDNAIEAGSPNGSIITSSFSLSEDNRVGVIATKKIKATLTKKDNLFVLTVTNLNNEVLVEKFSSFKSSALNFLTSVNTSSGDAQLSLVCSSFLQYRVDP